MVPTSIDKLSATETTQALLLGAQPCQQNILLQLTTNYEEAGYYLLQVLEQTLLPDVAEVMQAHPVCAYMGRKQTI